MRAKDLFLVACSLTLAAHLCNIGCSGESPTPNASAPSAPSATSASSASSATSETTTSSTADVKIMKQFWEGTKNLKFWNEMRRDENGRWDRNGIGRAYYAGGMLEREGMYRNGKRVGVWTYYDVDGKVLRTENRGDGGAADDATPRP
jgi:hypothetical protein